MANETFPCGKHVVEVLYLDNHLLVIRKPPNAPVQKDSSGDPDILTSAKAYIKQKFDKPGEVYLGLVHRLDRPVGGVMVLARTSKAAERLSKAFSGHDLEKKYLAVVHGSMESPMDMEDYLLKNESSGSSRVVPKETQGAKYAHLLSEPLYHADALTLVCVTLYTGRSHQIRVQHASRHMPLWGDIRYGQSKPGQQIALWAYSLTITHPTQKEKMTFASMPPEDGIWATMKEGLPHG